MGEYEKRSPEFFASKCETDVCDRRGSWDASSSDHGEPQADIKINLPQKCDPTCDSQHHLVTAEDTVLRVWGKSSSLVEILGVEGLV